MESLAKVITDILEAESSLGLELGTDLFIGREPDLPKNCVTVWETGGGSPALTMDTGADYFYGAVQLTVRNMNYETGFSLANSILEVLNGYDHTETSDRSIELIRCENGPFPLEWDQNAVKFNMNFEIQYRKL